MVGGGSRRDDGSLVINNPNVFAALDTLRKKKKQKEPEPQVIWQPAPLNSKLWADADDDDEDDYFATTAPLPSAWGAQEPQKGEESESEEDFLDEGDEDVEEEDHDHEPEPEVQVHPEPVVKKPVEVSAVPKETDRQLSKKERKKKELAELEALLADFGVTQKDANQQDETRENAQETKDGEPNGDGEKKENALGESKSAKKKKKKDKASKEVKENQDQPANSVVNNGPVEAAGAEHVEEDSSAIDMKEKLKRMASAKKKKSSKDNTAAAKAAAQEAAVRSARLAAAKNKEKNHYNQQPVR